MKSSEKTREGIFALTHEQRHFFAKGDIIQNYYNSEG